MRSVPPRGSGWVGDQHATFKGSNAIGSTHPLPRGGTDTLQDWCRSFEAKLSVAYIGRSILNSDPLPGSLATLIFPPCCSTICFTIAKPNPVPRFFVE